MEKTAAFFENARLLHTAFSIAPLMYGSLGLQYLTRASLDADDIDILIPEELLTQRWAELKVLLETHGYALINEHEHEFVKDGLHYAYARIEELKSFASIRLPDIPRRSYEGIPFLLLTLEQYLRVYTASSRDGYRITARNKKDHDKIRLIESLLVGS